MIFLKNLKSNFQNSRILKLLSKLIQLSNDNFKSQRKQSDLGIQQVLHGEFYTHH